MGPIEERYPWVFLALGFLLIGNALLWMVEGLSRAYGPRVWISLAVLCLVGSAICFSVWRKSRKRT